MKRPMLLAGLIAAAVAALPAAPAQAQLGQRVLTIYGDEKCPTSSGEEIVVCRRLPIEEKYRIPLDLRAPDDPRSATWAQRARSFEYVGASGIGSCTPVGAGGGLGCFNQMVKQAREESRAKGEAPAIPLKLP